MASSFVQVTGELFLINDVDVPHNTKKPTKYDNKVFKDMYFFYLLAINALGMSSNCFVYKRRVGDNSTEFGKILLKILKKNVKTILRGVC